jgi:hypothetical protein
MSMKIELDRDDLVEALRHLEIIVLSLDRIGSASTDMSGEEQRQVLSDFFDEWSVGARLRRIRHLLAAAFDYDELIELFGDAETWNSNHRRPTSEVYKILRYIETTIETVDSNHRVAHCSELTSDGDELRRIEFLSDGRIMYSDRRNASLDTQFHEGATMHVADSESNTSAKQREITKEDFERLWSRRSGD